MGHHRSPPLQGLIVSLDKALGKALAKALGKALAKTLGNALAKALANALAKALAKAFRLFRDENWSSLLCPDRQREEEEREQFEEESTQGDLCKYL